MTDSDLRGIVLGVLRQISPETELAALDPAVDLRDQIDVDSMDLLNFVLGLNSATGVDIPERDYPRLSSIDGCVTYLAAHGVQVGQSRSDPTR